MDNFLIAVPGPSITHQEQGSQIERMEQLKQWNLWSLALEKKELS